MMGKAADIAGRVVFSMKKLMNPRAAMCFSMAIFGTIGLFTRRIGLPSSEIALYRAMLATLLLTAYLFFTKQPVNWRAIRKELPLLLFSGASIGINWVCLFQAYRYTTISTATLCYYFAPVIVTAVSPFLFKEKLSPRQILCFCMSTLGLVLLTVAGGMGRGSRDFTGILFGLGAAVFYAAVILLNKYIRNVSGIHRTYVQFFGAIAALLPYVLLTGGVTLGNLDAQGWLCLLVVGFGYTGILYCLYFYALKELPGQKSAILSYLDPLVAVLVSVLVLREGITLLQIMGGLLILGFTLYNEITPRKERHT